MKKQTIIFVSLFMAFTVLAFNVEAQNVKHISDVKSKVEPIKSSIDMPVMKMAANDCKITLAAGDVWGDGSGYQMLLDNTALLFGTTIPSTGSLTASGDAPSATYAQFSHKIPVNADGSLSTTNIVMNGQVSIVIPAGTYDYCITNPTPGDRMWIASGDYGRKDDIVFQAGKEYTFTVSINSSTGNDQVVMTSALLGLDDVNSATSISMYPNPAMNSTRITANGINGKINLSIFDAQGRVAKTVDAISNNNSIDVNVDLSGFTKGVYFVRIGSDVQKLIVQ
ncbi:MAG: rgpA [Bacteroidetes bacterium]|nr:rgpA [Bacteroidota bacterium]